MSEANAPTGTRYRAFISYSHKDTAFASRLHRRLEGYVLPKRLGVGRRLTPIFKDREELPAAHDLSAQVRAALAASDCLIVVCSPDAAASQWVGREIETFRALHPDRPILAALVRGEPAEAFPEALAAGGIEPLAADFRRTADGERLALLKLIAGISDFGVDQLIQRDAQSRLRGGLAVTAIAVGAMIVMGLTAALALNAQAAAERQRAAAESLVEFMLGDLREQLRGVGRFTVLDSVNRRVLDYYNSQYSGHYPDDSLKRRAALLHAMGEDKAGQDHFREAAAHFDEAYNDTRALLEKAPRAPDRLFAHAQSAYWRGYIAYRQQRTAAARTLFLEYLSLAQRLRAAQPQAARSFQEVGYANSNLCALEVEQGGNVQQALDYCQSALEGTQRAFEIEPGDRDIQLDMTTRLGWLSEVQLLLGDFVEARASRLRQKGLLKALLIRDPESAVYRDAWGACHRGLSAIDYRQGDIRSAINNLQVSRDVFKRLTEVDPNNSRWKNQLEYADRTISFIKSRQHKEMRP